MARAQGQTISYSYIEPTGLQESVPLNMRQSAAICSPTMYPRNMEQTIRAIEDRCLATLTELAKSAKTLDDVAKVSAEVHKIYAARASRAQSGTGVVVYRDGARVASFGPVGPDSPSGVRAEQVAVKVWIDGTLTATFGSPFPPEVVSPKPVNIDAKVLLDGVELASSVSEAQ
jgi:hypothetical protein